MRDWGEDIWSKLLRIGRRWGRPANWGNARERSKTQVEGFKEGDLVLKRFSTGEARWGNVGRGFEVLGRDGLQGGYRLKGWMVGS